MKAYILLLLLMACQTESTSEQQTAPAKADVVQTHPETNSTPEATEGEEKTDVETSSAEKVDGTPQEDTPKAPASNDTQEAKKTGSVKPAGSAFIGYDHAGKKGSLPMDCPMCRRMWTKKESQFVKACNAQGGESKVCNCLTILCSVDVK